MEWIADAIQRQEGCYAFKSVARNMIVSVPNQDALAENDIFRPHAHRKNATVGRTPVVGSARTLWRGLHSAEVPRLYLGIGSRREPLRISIPWPSSTCLGAEVISLFQRVRLRRNSSRPLSALVLTKPSAREICACLVFPRRLVLRGPTQVGNLPQFVHVYFRMSPSELPRLESQNLQCIAQVCTQIA